jgi:hypothetical protein
MQVSPVTMSYPSQEPLQRPTEGELGNFCFLPLAFILGFGGFFRFGLLLWVFLCGKLLEGKRITEGKRFAKGKLLKGKEWLKRG